MLDQAEAQARAKSMRESVRTHKRIANSHRKRAKEEMKALERFERTCKEFGITLIIENEHQVQGGPSNNDHTKDSNQAG